MYQGKLICSISLYVFSGSNLISITPFSQPKTPNLMGINKNIKMRRASYLLSKKQSWFLKAFILLELVVASDLAFVYIFLGKIGEQGTCSTLRFSPKLLPRLVCPAAHTLPESSTPPYSTSCWTPPGCSLRNCTTECNLRAVAPYLDVWLSALCTHMLPPFCKPSQTGWPWHWNVLESAVAPGLCMWGIASTTQRGWRCAKLPWFLRGRRFHRHQRAKTADAPSFPWQASPVKSWETVVSRLLIDTFPGLTRNGCSAPTRRDWMRCCPLLR